MCWEEIGSGPLVPSSGIPSLSAARRTRLGEVEGSCGRGVITSDTRAETAAGPCRIITCWYDPAHRREGRRTRACRSAKNARSRLFRPGAGRTRACRGGGHRPARTAPRHRSTARPGPRSPRDDFEKAGRSSSPAKGSDTSPSRRAGPGRCWVLRAVSAAEASPRASERGRRRWFPPVPRKPKHDFQQPPAEQLPRPGPG